MTDNLKRDRLSDQLAVRLSPRQRDLLRLSADWVGLSESEFLRRGLAGLLSGDAAGRTLADQVVGAYRSAFRAVVDSARGLSALRPADLKAPDTSAVSAAAMHELLANVARLYDASARLQAAMRATDTPGLTFVEPTTTAKV